MSDISYIAEIVKILETPKQKLINSNTFVIKFRAQLSQFDKTQIIRVFIWGNLADAVLNYYKINDYILIEGYSSLRDNLISDMNRTSVKTITITVVTVYPFLLSYNGSINKLF
jgi:hypothetical protein